jgi:hypothetical protein
LGTRKDEEQPPSAVFFVVLRDQQDSPRAAVLAGSGYVKNGSRSNGFGNCWGMDIQIIPIF